MYIPLLNISVCYFLYWSQLFKSLHYPFLFFKDFINLFLERGEGREKDKGEKCQWER